MKRREVDLFYGAILHDIGKVVQRASGERKKHAIVGAEWLEDKLGGQHPEITAQVRNHMASFQERSLKSNSLAYITYIADNIASGIDRRKSIEEGEHAAPLWDTYTNQEDIFNRLYQVTSKRYYQPRELNVKEAPNYASQDNKKFSKGDYAKILGRLEEVLTRHISFDETYINSMLNLLEATLSFVPASTNTQEVADISLFEHSKLTAGIAACIYRYLEMQGEEDYQSRLFAKSQAFYNEEAFLLVSFDMSGIQDFIYNIVTNGALKQLKARSFYLDFMSEHIVDSLLAELELTRANLLYAGGGHAYLILPNTLQTIEILKQFEVTFNRFLLMQFQTRLYVAFGWQAFSAKTIMSDQNSAETYRALYQSVSRMISDKKLSRYDWKTLMLLNRGGKKSERECQNCHLLISEQDEAFHDFEQVLCELCYKLRKFSRENDMSDNRFFIINANEKGLPIGPDAYLSVMPEKQIKSGMAGRIYTKNDFHTGEQVTTHIFVGDYSAAPIDQYAQLSVKDGYGIKRVAVVRLDVDDLGSAFMGGFSHQGEGKYNTLSRSATFSRVMSQFFKVYINQIAQGKQLTIVYSGGDDVFAIGAWQDIIDFTINLRQKFIVWTNGKLTLSAGIGIFPDKTPISIMARETGFLEECAKSAYPEKDAITLFKSDYTFRFDEFIEKVENEKLLFIRGFFNTQDERGKSFLYRLLELIQSEDKMDVARMAYYLSRMEDLTKAENKKDFKVFKKNFFEWSQAPKQIKKQVELALVLYIYEIRKETV